MDLPRLDCRLPFQFAEGEGQPGFRVKLDNVGRGAATMGQALDALDCAKWRNADFNRIAGTQEGEFFEQVANRCRLLGFIARAKALDGLAAVLGFYFSAGHTPILHA